MTDRQAKTNGDWARKCLHEKSQKETRDRISQKDKGAKIKLKMKIKTGGKDNETEYEEQDRA